MQRILDSINKIVWGLPVLAMILLVGLLLSFHSRFAQIRFLPLAVRKFIQSIRRKDRTSEQISGYRALCTALAATVGTGNIAGVAGAIAIGGPGVIFWMWICALLGMVTKLAEVVLAMRYRTKNEAGEYMGGPMYMILHGLPGRYHFLAYLYAFFGVVAAFGVGNATQVNTVVDGMRSLAKMSNVSFGVTQSLIVGGILAVLITAAFARGAKGVGSWAERMVPAASVLYILLCAGVLLIRFHKIPDAFMAIISGAFRPRSATCGVITSVLLTLRIGTSRGVFTNESGMGTASIAHASANVNHPMEQGLMGMIEVFLDTIIICTLTALVILCSDVSISYGTDPGIALTLDAFAGVYGNGIRVILTVLVCVFAFATILGWGFYGVRCAQFLFGARVWNIFVWLQAFGVILGVILKTGIVWVLAEILNGLMALPNLIALLLLAPEFKFLVTSFVHKEKAHSS